jgi:hypothetical protein
MKAGVGIAANVGDESDDSRDLGLYGGGGAGFITTSGAIPPRFIFSGAVLERLTVGEMGEVGDRGCVPRISTPSSLTMMLWDCSGVCSSDIVDLKGLGRGLPIPRSDSIF